MPYRKLKKEIVIKFVELLKKRKYLPFKIKMNKCPSRKKSCNKHHGEIIVTSYDSKKKKFHLKYYSMHERGVQFQYDQPKDFVIELIHSCVLSGKRLITTKQLMKIGKIDLNKSLYRTEKLTLRFSEEEFNSLMSKSNKKNLSIYDFCRSKLVT